MALSEKDRERFTNKCMLGSAWPRLLKAITWEFLEDHQQKAWLWDAQVALLSTTDYEFTMSVNPDEDGDWWWEDEDGVTAVFATAAEAVEAAVAHWCEQHPKTPWRSDAERALEFEPGEEDEA